MRIFPYLLAIAVPAGAQVRIETGAGPAGAPDSAAAVSITAVPVSLAELALTNVGMSALGVASAGPVVAPPTAAAALPPSAISVIDPAKLPGSDKRYTEAEWTKLVASAPDEGTRAVLQTMSAGTEPRLALKLADGSSVSGSFLGLAGDKIAFRSDRRLLGLDLNSRDIVEVRRTADVWFDGGTLRPEEVVVHSKPGAVADPFKDLGAFKGRYVETVVRDLDDLKEPAQTFAGKLLKADGDVIELDGPKGRTAIRRELYRVDAVRTRFQHYDSRGRVSSLLVVNDHILPGTPVELAIPSKAAPAKGLFRGVRSDEGGIYVLIETANPDGTFTVRGFHDVESVRTQDYTAGELMTDASPVFIAPDAPS